MKKRNRIITYIIGFYLAIIAIYGFIFLLSNGSESMASFLTIGLILLIAAALVPLFFMKRLMKLSQDVEKDGSTYRVKDFAEPEPEPEIKK